MAIIGSFADAHDLQPGDRFGAIIHGRRQVLTVTAVVESPEFIYTIPPGGMLPDYERYGVLWMSRESLEAAMDMKGAFNSLVVTINRGASENSVIEALDRLLDRYGVTGAFARSDQFSHRFLNDELSQLKTMATVFPAIFMTVAMFLLNVVINRLTNTSRIVAMSFCEPRSCNASLSS
ncbi:hypothetical protein GCM10023079_56660 [Streptomyces chitinivorans]